MRFSIACLAFAASISLAQPCTPPAPQGVQCTPQPCYVQVRWNWVYPSNRYEVYRRFPGEAEELIGSAEYPPFTDLTSRSGGAFYSVRAIATCGEGLRSAEVFGQPLAGAPGTIDRFELGWVPSCEDVRLSWRWPNDGYPTVQRIWRSPDADFNHAAIVGTTDYYWWFYDTSGTPGVQYWYWIDRTLGPCTTARSGPVTARIGLLTQAPTSLTATFGTMCGAIMVTWWNPSCASGSELWRSPTPNLADASLISTSGPLYDTAVDEGVPYWYWARAVTSQQIGPFAGPVQGARSDEVPPTVTMPTEGAAYPGGSVNLSPQEFGGAEPSTLSCQWRREGEPIVDSDRIFGAQTSMLTINDARASDQGMYDLVVTSPCGSTISDPLQLFVGYEGCPPFTGDYNNDGGVDGSDVEAFFTDWEAAALCADVNRDGGIDGGDMEWFFICWESC